MDNSKALIFLAIKQLNLPDMCFHVGLSLSAMAWFLPDRSPTKTWKDETRPPWSVKNKVQCCGVRRNLQQLSECLKSWSLDTTASTTYHQVQNNGWASQAKDPNVMIKLGQESIAVLDLEGQCYSSGISCGLEIFDVMWYQWRIPEFQIGLRRGMF
jgi:hypothetical protein